MDGKHFGILTMCSPRPLFFFTPPSFRLNFFLHNFTSPASRHAKRFNYSARVRPCSRGRCARVWFIKFIRHYVTYRRRSLKSGHTPRRRSRFCGARRRHRRRTPSVGVLPSPLRRRVAHLAAARAVARFGAH